MKKYQSFLSENFQFLEMKFSIYLNRRVFVMSSARPPASVVTGFRDLSESMPQVNTRKTSPPR